MMEEKQKGAHTWVLFIITILPSMVILPRPVM